MLNYSYIDSKNSLEPPEQGLGIYTGIVHEKWTPPYIKPDASEYMKHFYMSKHIPGYTRIGNNTLDC